MAFLRSFNEVSTVSVKRVMSAVGWVLVGILGLVGQAARIYSISSDSRDEVQLREDVSAMSSTERHKDYGYRLTHPDPYN